MIIEATPSTPSGGVPDLLSSVNRLRDRLGEDERHLSQFVQKVHLLAEAKFNEGDPQRSEALLREAMFRLAAARASYPYEMAETAAALAFLYDHQGKRERAREFYPKAIRYAAGAGLRATDLGVRLCENHAALCRSVGAEGEARLALQQALALLHRCNRDESAQTAELYNKLADMAAAKRCYVEAMDNYRKALAIQETLQATDLGMTEKVRATCDLLSALHTLLGQTNEASAYAQRAATISGRSVKPHPPEIVVGPVLATLSLSPNLYGEPQPLLRIRAMESGDRPGRIGMVQQVLPLLATRRLDDTPVTLPGAMDGVAIEIRSHTETPAPTDGSREHNPAPVLGWKNGGLVNRRSLPPPRAADRSGKRGAARRAKRGPISVNRSSTPPVGASAISHDSEVLPP